MINPIIFSFREVFVFLVIYTSIVAYIGYRLKKSYKKCSCLYPIGKPNVSARHYKIYIDPATIELTDWTSLTRCEWCTKWKLIVGTEINGEFGWICSRCLF